MPLTSVAAFADALRAGSLLDAEQLDEMDRLLLTGPELPALTAELVRRGWLTAYQVAQVWQGRAAELVLGRYVLMEPLGQGGMGRVFKARHRHLDRVVAVKRIRHDQQADAEAARRFRRETRLAGRLQHPNVVIVHDADEIDGTLFFVMEYVEGSDLERLVGERGPLPVARACDYLRQAALGLQHAHEHGLVHRDVKPSNLLVTADDRVVKVLDLGLARRDRGTDEERLVSILTRTGMMVGTFDYQAPEQALDAHAADVRADIYGLGCTLYFLLTGKPPFAECSPAQKLLCHQRTAPPPLDELRPGLPAGLGAVVQRMLAKKPGDRFAVPAELAAALVPFTREASRAPAPEPARPKPVRPRPTPPPTARRKPLAEHEALNSLGMRLVRVPGGAFLMGSSAFEAGRGDDEGPPHEVTLRKPFWVGAFPVTQAEYEWLMRHNPASFPKELGGGPDHPVETVSWYDAVEFCRRLSALPDEKLAGRSYRLPTEAEWEYFCRAGSSTAFCFGEALSARQANFDGRYPYVAATGPCLERTTGVGSYAPNAWGLYDLHGNVWEWCRDWYDPEYYRRSVRKPDPAGPPRPRDARRVLRGGAWDSYGRACRAAARYALPPGSRFPSVGFRIVCTALLP